ncbi:hypothetical protein Scep_000243 [Stephania cephalantha]|uniref:Fatty acid desaturase domain-containing protein n=1 Tax=Stephania cephalantha TaxID=152367 RepID=A0AAP0Q291_9MAGN
MASKGSPKLCPTSSMPNSSSKCKPTTTTTTTTSSSRTKARHDRPVEENLEVKIRKIVFSDVVVKRKNRAYWVRKWRLWDLTISIGVMVHVHVMCFLYAYSTFSLSRFLVGLCIGIITGMFGISVSYHRNLAHRAFNLPKWLEYLFAYCGILSFQGHPILWVSMHRLHHQFADEDRDPHSPTEGFWFSHMNWIFDIKYILQKRGGVNNVRDLEKQFFYRFLQKTNYIHPFLPAIPLLWWGGFPMLVWGLYVRTALAFHSTFLVNSACHIWGYQAWNTGDLSKNNWLVALITFGEGWHNNHHAFEFSARHGHEWWQFDPGWYVIKLLELVGLATHVKVPSETQKQRMVALNKKART